MKTKLFLCLAVGLLAFTACQEPMETVEQIGEEVVFADAKANMIYSFATVFTDMARQPEIADAMIDAALKTWNINSYEDYLPLNDKALRERGIARGCVVGAALTAIARQPEIVTEITDAALLLIGAYDAALFPDTMVDYAKGIALTHLTDALARQPEAASLLRAFMTRFLGTPEA